MCKKFILNPNAQRKECKSSGTEVIILSFCDSCTVDDSELSFPEGDCPYTLGWVYGRHAAIILIFIGSLLYSTPLGKGKAILQHLFSYRTLPLSIYSASSYYLCKIVSGMGNGI